MFTNYLKMGQPVSKVFYDYCPERISSLIGHKRKRNISDDDESLLEKSLHLPKKVKLACTTEYIYKALFLEGGDCDVYVNILDKEWKLHKIYLQQSPYFASMFSGSWNESNKSHITIEVADSNITMESLTVVLGSLYFDEPSIEPFNVVSILAAATLFQMDGLIEQCINLMVENISPLTVMPYYEAACQYGIQKVKTATKEWFSVNLMTFYPKHSQKLRMVDIDLMADVVNNFDLVVIASEFSLYILLRFWMFLRLNPSWKYFNDPGLTVVKNFYQNRADMKSSFLLTPEGHKFIKVFRNLRLHNLLLYLEDLNTLIEDHILPQSWIFPKISAQYQSVLKVFQSLDRGPTTELPSEEFFKSCLRCGRIVTSSETQTWRWNLFNFGVHLNWTISDNAVKIQRIRKANDYLTSEENNTRQILVRVRVLTLDKYHQIKKSLSSGLVSVSLIKSAEVKILDLEKDIDYPLIVSVNIMYVTPEPNPQKDTNENNSGEQ